MYIKEKRNKQTIFFLLNDSVFRTDLDPTKLTRSKRERRRRRKRMYTKKMGKKKRREKLRGFYYCLTIMFSRKRVESFQIPSTSFLPFTNLDPYVSAVRRETGPAGRRGPPAASRTNRGLLDLLPRQCSSRVTNSR